jgi:hypothetical protein
MKNRFKRLSISLLACLLLTGCGPGQWFGPTITPTPTLTFTPSPTFTATATSTPSLTPTVTPTDTPPPTATSLPTSDEIGGSFETAIVIEASNEFEGISMEYQWLDANYPGYEFLSQATTSYNGKMYDIISIRTADGIRKDIYFDISLFFGKF